jgi:hypothetical protein
MVRLYCLVLLIVPSGLPPVIVRYIVTPALLLSNSYYLGYLLFCSDSTRSTALALVAI